MHWIHLSVLDYWICLCQLLILSFSLSLQSFFKLFLFVYLYIFSQVATSMMLYKTWCCPYLGLRLTISISCIIISLVVILSTLRYNSWTTYVDGINCDLQSIMNISKGSPACLRIREYLFSRSSGVQYDFYNILWWCHLTVIWWWLWWFLVFCATFSNIMATSFSGGRSRSTRREPPTMGKQLVNFIACGCESSPPFFCNLQSRGRTHAVLVILSNSLSHPGPTTT